MALKLLTYLHGLSAFETTDANTTKAVSLWRELSFYLILGVVECDCLCVAELLQTSLNGG